MSNLPANATSMTSREIAELTGKQHAHVMRDIRVMLSQLHGGKPEDYAPEKVLENQENPFLDHGVMVACWGANSAGLPLFEYRLDKDHTLTLLTGYDANARIKVIRRWQELEANAATPALPDFTNPAEAARAWADQFEHRQIAEQKVIAMQPKADFHDRVTQSPDLLTIREAAKVLRTGERRLFGFLKQEGLLMGSNIPYQSFMDRGLFRLVETPWTDQLGRERISVKTCVTQKGMAFIQGLQDRLAMYQT